MTAQESGTDTMYRAYFFLEWLVVFSRLFSCPAHPYNTCRIESLPFTATAFCSTDGTWIQQVETEPQLGHLECNCCGLWVGVGSSIRNLSPSGQRQLQLGADGTDNMLRLVFRMAWPQGSWQACIPQGHLCLELTLPLMK